MAQFDESPILSLGSEPIPGADPCGADATEDARYINVMAEFSKHGRIEVEGDPEWYQVEQDCVAILKDQCKDVEIASILGHALFMQHGYAGLSAALGMIAGMVTNFWDGLQPTRPRRRKARIETLADQFVEGLWFREHQPKPDDFDALDVCVERGAALKTALTERMPDDPPEFRKFLEGLKDHAGKRPKKVAPAPDAPAPGTGQPVAAGGASSAGSFSATEVSDVGGAVSAVLSACTFIKKADPTDPLPYAVSRFVKWAKISLPTSDDAKFKIPPPEKTVLEALPHQLSNGLWDHLLKGTESAFRSSDPLWLDLQRYACAAMTGLGPAYDAARQTIMGLTGALVQRLGEGLFELRFSDGTPLCGGETRLWIESELAPTEGRGGGGGSGDANGKLTEAHDKAKKLAGSGKLKEGLQELQAGLLCCHQRRDRFLWRLRIAQLCFDAQRLQLAAPLLEECFDEIQRYHIDEWEPMLAVDVAQTLYRCRKALTAATKDPRPEVLDGVRDSFAWLCQLDPLAALAAEPSGK